MIFKANADGDKDTLAIWQYWDTVTSAWVDATVLPSINDDVYCNGKELTTEGALLSYKSFRNTENVDLGINVNGKITFTAAANNHNSIIIGTLYQGAATLIFYSKFTSAYLRRTVTVLGDAYLGNSLNAMIRLTSHQSIIGHDRIIHIGTIYGNGACAFAELTTFTNRSFSGSFTGTYYAGDANICIMSRYYTYGLPSNIVGNVYASDSATCFTMAGDTTNVDVIEGNLYPSASYPAISNLCKVKFINSKLYTNGIQGAISITALLNMIIEGSFLWQFPSDDGYTALSNVPNNLHAPISDVRTGVVFDGGLKTGTCAVPPKASVALNVPVDDTVGELVAGGGGATADEIISALKADGLGLRLAQCATEAQAGQILEAIEAIPAPNPGTTPSEIIEALKADELGLRLADCSTIAITGKQIAGATPDSE